MTLQESVVSAWYMACCVCKEESKQFLTTMEVLNHLKEIGWVNKSYFKNNIACEDWYCPKCLDKATEMRDTLPPTDEEVTK